MKKTIIIIFILVISLSSKCKWYNIPDDELNIVKQNYKGDELRIDGYYYYVSVVDETTYYQIYFLYSNGVILGGVLVDEKKLIEMEEDFIDGTYYDRSIIIKHRWGLFVINDSINFERWYPIQGPLPIVTHIGVVLNDTTFHISERYILVNGQKTEILDRNETYHFKKFSPKPDSTNSFIP